MMRDELLYYYERELRFIRRLAADFAHRYPAVAGQLLLEPDKCEDPHVERLIEACAMLTARVQMRLDDEFPEITQAFLGLLYPHYLAPIPSCTVAQFVPDADRVEATTGMEIPRHTLLHTPPVSGVRARFRTCFPLTLWPVETAAVEVVALNPGEPGCPPEATAAVRVVLRTLGSRPFRELGIDRLQFFLDGDASLAHALYELLFRDPLGLVVQPRREERGRRGRRPVVFLTPEKLRPVGFARDEGLLEYGQASQLGYRLLQEYFAFPDKFLFAEVSGLAGEALQAAERELELLILLRELPLELEGKLGPGNLKLGCTPAVNLFPHQAEPLRPTQTEAEYRVVPDMHAPLAYEVHSVLSVETIDPGSGETRVFRPFYALRHGDRRGEEAAFWHASRQPSGREDDAGTEVWLSLVDRGRQPLKSPPGETLVVRTLCTNRNLPPELPLGEGRDGLQIEGHPGVARVHTLRKPTRPLRAPLREDTHWRLISLLSLNHLSLVGADGNGGASGDSQPLRELLSLLDFTQSAVTRQRIAGLMGLQARRILRRVTADGQRIFARGLEIALEFDETKYAGSGVFLFAAILEHFLGLYASLNSFTETVARIRQREGVLKRWPPRAGEMTLL
jgi:type VI secretion system protein ImpG